jgi:parvulin-like peptidyl-prolyl isomerase
MHKPTFFLAIFLLAAVLGLAGCGEPTARLSTADLSTADLSQADRELVIAEDRLGPISLADVDRFVLDLPAAQRWQENAPPAQVYGAVARRLAVDRLLYDEALLVGADQDSSVQDLDRRLRRDTYVAHHLQQQATRQPLSEEQMRAYYEEHRQRFQRGERRDVLQIFKRFPAGGERGPALAAIATLRQRSLAGESFELLAREQSDSETRHEGGRLGLISRGSFPPDFDRVVFALEAGVPSQVIKTADGAHLFFVNSILEARDLTFEDARKRIVAEMSRELREELWKTATEGMELPPGSIVLNADELTQILRTGDPDATVLQIGEAVLSAGALRELVSTRHQQLGPRQDRDLVKRLLDEVRRSEIIYQHLEREGLPEIPQEGIEKALRRQLVDRYARRKMTAFLDQDPDRIRGYYDNNQMRFATPLRVRLRRLVVARGDDPAALMARLENARADLDAGRLDLDAMAESVGGRVRDLGRLTAAQLQKIDGRALRFAFLLKTGEHSPPYQVGNFLVLFQVTQRQEPEPRPLARVRDQVVQDMLATSSAVLFRELSEQLLGEAGFRLFEEKLEGVGTIVGP